ncbi:hypothetical protein ACSQ67_013901 [Phaseolus vulgaris]
MDITFVLENERTFCIEVSLFDSFLEIKQKVQKYKAIPASSQTLIFNGQILQNDDVIFHTHISQQSRLKLLVDPEYFANPAVTLPLPLQFAPPPNENDYGDMLQWNAEKQASNRGNLEEELLRISAALSETTLPPLCFEDDSANALPQWKPEFKPAPPPLLPTPPAIIRLTVKIVAYRAKPFFLEMDLDDTVLQLKERIYRMKKPRNVNLNEVSVRIKSGEELHDQLSLRDCGMLNLSVIYVHRKSAESEPPPKFTFPAVTADGGVGAKMVKIMVVPKDGTQKIPIEVNSFNRVEDLRYELEKFHKHVLPENNSYFFTNKDGHVMTETHSFNWYGIEDGDVIEITPEYVSDESNP